MLTFREPSQYDIPYQVKWLNDSTISRFFRANGEGLITQAQQEQWFVAYQINHTQACFTIDFNARPIGLMGLSAITPSKSHATLFILIGEPDFHGQGHGQRALRWLIDYGFSQLNLQQISLEVFDQNLPAKHIYEKLGFSVIKSWIIQGTNGESTSKVLLRMAMRNPNRRCHQPAARRPACSRSKKIPRI